MAISIKIISDIAISLIGINRTAIFSHVQTDMCVKIFVTAIFVIAKHWKQPKCPSIGNWLNKCAGTSKQ